MVGTAVSVCSFDICLISKLMSLKAGFKCRGSCRKVIGIYKKQGRRRGACLVFVRRQQSAAAATAVAVLATLATCFGGFFAVVGEVAAAVVTTLAAGLGSFLSIIGEVARVVICHVFFSSIG
jgi:hypothetical protein